MNVLKAAELINASADRDDPQNIQQKLIKCTMLGKKENVSTFWGGLSFIITQTVLKTFACGPLTLQRPLLFCLFLFPTLVPIYILSSVPRFIYLFIRQTPTFLYAETVMVSLLFVCPAFAAQQDTRGRDVEKGESPLGNFRAA